MHVSAIAKERVYDELRRYHTDVFPDTLATERMTDIKTEFGEAEDKVVTMLLRLVNGKEGFVDTSNELTTLRDRITALSPSSSEEPNRSMFAVKIDGLLGILSLAKDSNFQLRKLRPKKAAKQTPTA